MFAEAESGFGGGRGGRRRGLGVGSAEVSSTEGSSAVGGGADCGSGTDVGAGENHRGPGGTNPMIFKHFID